MKSFALVLFVVWLTEGGVSADDQIRRLQEALRKRNLFFGEIDGRQTEETTGAIRRFQQRQGLPQTGEPTPPTLSSLGIARPAPGTVEWPEGPVLKSDTARELAVSERHRLEDLAPTLPEPIAEPPLSLVPVTPLGEPPTAPQEFVRKYLTACESNRLPGELAFYSDHVDYFDHGRVDTAFIERDVQRYYKRWPHRHYDLLDCKLLRTKADEWEAMFRIAFRYRDEKAQTVAGKSVNFFTIHQDHEGLHFTSMKEQVVRD